MFGVKLLGVVGFLFLAALPWPLSRLFDRENPGRTEAAWIVQEAEAAFRNESEGRIWQFGLRPERRYPGDHFGYAAHYYDQLRGAGFGNAALYQNQANAYLLHGSLPEAILAYRRGLRHDPSHRRLQENLEYARSQVAYPTPETRPPSPAWPPWLSFPSPDFVLLLALLAYALACVSLARWLMIRRGLLRTLLLGGLASALGLIAWLLLQQHWADPERPLVVVAAKEAAFRLGNGSNYFSYHPEVPYLPRGLEARRLHQRGDWLQLELASGHVGWIHRRDAIVDE